MYYYYYMYYYYMYYYYMYYYLHVLLLTCIITYMYYS